MGSLFVQNVSMGQVQATAKKKLVKMNLAPPAVTPFSCFYRSRTFWKRRCSFGAIHFVKQYFLGSLEDNDDATPQRCEKPGSSGPPAPAHQGTKHLLRGTLHFAKSMHTNFKEPSKSPEHPKCRNTSRCGGVASAFSINFICNTCGTLAEENIEI